MANLPFATRCVVRYLTWAIITQNCQKTVKNKCKSRRSLKFCSTFLHRLLSVPDRKKLAHPAIPDWIFMKPVGILSAPITIVVGICNGIRVDYLMRWFNSSSSVPSGILNGRPFTPHKLEDKITAVSWALDSD